VDTAVCAPNDGWMYYAKHIEQFPDINKLCNVASCWIYRVSEKDCTFFKFFFFGGGVPDVLLEICAHGNGGYFNQN
jgi:hypothetical protein